MIERTKYVRSMLVKHTNDTTDTVSDNVLSAFDQFIHKEEVNVTENKIVPFHAIQYVESSVTQESEEVDNKCDLTCSVIPNPTLTAPTTTLEVDAGEEFDPLIGVSAVDGNGKEVEVTASIAEDEGYLMTENSIDITDENDNPLIGG